MRCGHVWWHGRYWKRVTAVRGGRYEELAPSSRRRMEDLEGARHLLAVGEYDRAFGLLGPYVDRLTTQGMVSLAHGYLNAFEREDVRKGLPDEARDLLALQEGDVQVALGDVRRSEESYREELAAFSPLVATDPRNLEWQRLVSVNLERLGRVLEVQRKVEEADDAFKQGLVIAHRLVATDSSNAGGRQILRTRTSMLAARY
jgi:hypothetical protein